jgi:hypothetical protein
VTRANHELEQLQKEIALTANTPFGSLHLDSMLAQFRDARLQFILDQLAQLLEVSTNFTPAFMAAGAK